MVEVILGIEIFCDEMVAVVVVVGWEVRFLVVLSQVDCYV